MGERRSPRLAVAVAYLRDLLGSEAGDSPLPWMVQVARSCGVSLVTAWKAARARSISVAGFDDTFDAVNFGITSWNHNAPALARRMVAHVLGEERGPGQGAEVTIEGALVLRQSTFKPPAAARGAA